MTLIQRSRNGVRLFTWQPVSDSKIRHHERIVRSNVKRKWWRHIQSKGNVMNESNFLLNVFDINKNKICQNWNEVKSVSWISRFHIWLNGFPIHCLSAITLINVSDVTSFDSILLEFLVDFFLFRGVHCWCSGYNWDVHWKRGKWCKNLFWQIKVFWKWTVNLPFAEPFSSVQLIST